MMEEIWKAIPGFDGYEVSNLGQVRSYKTKNNTEKKRTIPIVLKPVLLSGYRCVNLRNNNKTYLKKICYLIMLSFIGPRPNKMEVCHFNDIKTDDRLSNLRYDTHEANVHDAQRNGKMPIDFEKRKQIQRREDRTQKVLQIRSDYASGKNVITQLAQVYNVSIATVSRIVNGVTSPKLDGPIKGIDY